MTILASISVLFTFSSCGDNPKSSKIKSVHSSAERIDLNKAEARAFNYAYTISK